MKSSWKKIWENKKKKFFGNNINDLLKLNGWDTQVSTFSTNAWNHFVQNLIKKYKIKKGHKILEIGCGSGAFLIPFYKKKIACVGLDYSKSLLSVAKKVMPNAKLYLSEAKNLGQLKKYKFDFIFIHSVFQYFDSLKYANKVLHNLKPFLRKETKLFILDVPNHLKKKNWEQDQIRLLGKKVFLKRYKNFKHLFFKIIFFKQFCKKNNFKIKFLKSNLLKKKSSKYRLNILIEVKNK